MFFIDTFDYKKEGAIPPMAYLRSSITHMIIAKRRKGLIKQFHEAVWKAAEDEKLFDIYM